MTDINFNLLKSLDDKYGTPFYIMDGDIYKNNICNFVAAFKRRYEKVIAGYSFKTNYVPALCEIARRQGCYAEVVSEMEYELASIIGFKNILFNGPIKRKEIFFRALKDGAIINLDSEYEVDLACRYKTENPDEEVKVGIRININLIDENGNSVIQCGLRFGRFGFPNEILERNIRKLRSADIKIISLHGHTSTSDRAVLNYKVITEYMLRVCVKYQLSDLESFDIGGGYFGAAPIGLDLTGRPTYEDYANCVLDVALQNEWFVKQQPWIVIEPGSSVVSNVFSYYTKVYQNKTVGKVNFVIVDGTVFDVKPTMHSNNLPHEVFCSNKTNEICECDVVGSTCMEKDVILKDVHLPKLESGDYIQFRGVGAYTITLTPSFINYLAPILSYENGEFREIRRRQCIKDVLSVYNI